MKTTNQLVVVISHGLDNERASVAWSIANGGVKSGLEVSVFLVSAAVDWVRKGAADNVHLNPLDPSMKEMVDGIINNGCPVGVCPPCAKVRGYEAGDFIAGVSIEGSGFIHERIKEGAQVMTF
ncbi:DsrE family protein [Marinoscillum sp. MHG1-6]|uniref:DsrE family protein n=1 Tax=Marinoscillum sp. MHG1-6 TaxID=2959627 RepID=UPI0021583166|nr:DsrE family protein [Marinoscillum sp. MHG1-6]